MKKRICVLQVTPENPNQEHVKFFNTDDCDFYFVTHDVYHEDALQFCPNTTWTDTRNILAKNVPKNYDIKLFPEQISINYLISLDKFELVTPNMFEASIEFDIESKRQTVNLIKQPDFIENVRVYPKKVEYFLIKK